MAIMETQRFLIAIEGTFSGRTISAEEIKAIAANFVSGKKNIPVTYDFYNWSPVLSGVVDLVVDSDGEKMRLYAEINVTNELRSMAERKVNHFLVPALAGDAVNVASTRLVEVGVTKNPLIPGLDKMQFETPNHVDVIFHKRHENMTVNINAAHPLTDK